MTLAHSTLTHTVAMPDDWHRGWRQPSELRLRSGQGLLLNLGAGDCIRCDGGLAWITEPGRTEDRFLQPGQTFTATAAVELWISGLPAARLVLVAAATQPAGSAARPVQRVSWLHRLLSRCITEPSIQPAWR